MNVSYASAKALIRDLSPGSHACLLYRGVDELFELVLPFIEEGLTAGERCVWALPQGFTVDSAARALRFAVADLDRHALAGRLEIFPAREIYAERDGSLKPREEIIAAFLVKEREALAAGCSGLRATGDLAWVADAQLPALVEYERLCDDAITTRRTITGLCTYPVAGTPRGQVPGILSCHGDAIFKLGGWWRSTKGSEPGRAETVSALIENARP